MPYQASSGPYLTVLIQTAVVDGAKYGPIQAESLISFCVLDRVRSDFAKQARLEILPKIRELIEEGCVSATTDLWTGSYTSTQYLTVTLHMITKDLQLESLILFTKKFLPNGADSRKYQKPNSRKN